MLKDPLPSLYTRQDIESIDMEDFRHNYVNLTGFRMVDPEDKHTQTIMQDMEIYELQTDLQLLNTTGFLSLGVSHTRHDLQAVLLQTSPSR